MNEVCEFIVVAPASMGKAVERIEARLLAHLASEFPHYQFQIEPFGPFATDDDFSVIPIMNRLEGQAETGDALVLCRPLDPRVIPQIIEALRDFSLGGAALH